MLCRISNWFSKNGQASKIIEFLPHVSHSLPTILGQDILATVISARMFHYGNIWAGTPFGTADIPADGHFNTGTFQHWDFLAQGIFGKRNFQQRNILAQEHFGTGTFRHMDISAQ